MSEIKNGGVFNKEESCEGCPDRCPDPNCHDTCRGYKIRQQKKEKENAERRKDAEFKDAKIRAEQYTIKSMKNGHLKTRKKYE